MSKTHEKRQQRLTEHAEFLWKDAQMRAAMIQQVLDIAIAEWEEHKDELSDDINKQTEEHIAARKSELEQFLMAEKDLYLKRLSEI